MSPPIYGGSNPETPVFIALPMSDCDQKVNKNHVSLEKAFFEIASEYARITSVRYIVFGCSWDLTHALSTHYEIPKGEFVTAFVLFQEQRDGKYLFSLYTHDGPWLDGFSTVDASTGRVLEPRY